MGLAKENLEKISAQFTGNAKVAAMFSTNIEGKEIPWEMTFQLTLEGEDPFNLAINGDKATISDGVASNAGVILTGDPNSIVNIEDWNDYEIRADGLRIQLFINGKQTVDYTEEDFHINQEGLIGLQIHGGAKARVSYKDIRIKELP